MTIHHSTEGKIDAITLKKMRDQGDDMLLINVLPEEKFAEGHIAGSENVPSDSEHFVTTVARMAGGNRDKHVVVYCGGGKESSLAAFALEQAGFTNVDHFRGGMAEWKHLAYDVETGTPASHHS